MTAKPAPQKKTLAAVVGGAVALLAISFTGGQEGLRNAPYKDAANVWTVCYGETNVKMQRYTTAECQAMLDTSLAGYAEGVKKSTTGFDTLPAGAKVAAISMAYNAGLANYQKSTFKKMLAEKRLPEACDQLPKWRFVAGKDCAIRSNGCYGVYRRRLDERAACRGEMDETRIG